MQLRDTDDSLIVIGAGLAGLTAAATLAAQGLPVVVIEGSGQPGGRARTTDREGYLLNLGPHAIATDGPGTRVLRNLGVALPGRSPALAGARFLRDGELVHPIARRGGGAGLRVFGALARLALTARGPDPSGSVADLLDDITTDLHIRGVLDAIARLATYADAFEEQAADVLTEQLRGGSVRYLDAGWGALVERLRRTVAAAGGELRAGHARAVVTDRDGSVVAVELGDGTRLPAAAVIVAAGGPRDAAALLEGDARAVLERWGERASPVRMAALDVAFRVRPNVPPIVLGLDEPTYLSVHSDRSRLAPGAGAVVHVARFLPVDTQAPAGTREQLEGVLDRLDPAWRGQVVHARYLPGLVLTHDGATVATGGRHGRPGPAVPGTPGLYVAGDWVGTRGHLSQASLASAAAAAELAHAYVVERRSMLAASLAASAP